MDWHGGVCVCVWFVDFDRRSMERKMVSGDVCGVERFEQSIRFDSIRFEQSITDRDKQRFGRSIAALFERRNWSEPASTIFGDDRVLFRDNSMRCDAISLSL